MLAALENKREKNKEKKIPVPAVCQTETDEVRAQKKIFQNLPTMLSQ